MDGPESSFMNETPRQHEVREALEAMGDARHTARSWQNRDPDYVALLSLTQQDAPQLITIARQWARTEDWPEDENDMTVYAPVHAWRALAQLGTEDAVAPLLDMLDPLDERDDDWCLEEFPDALAMIGPGSLDAVTQYLAETSHRESPRICAGDALSKIAQAHPQTRDEVIRRLTGQLEKFAQQSEALNGFLISDLVDLNATQSAEVIERAFAADCVDVWIVGDWGDVRAELGVQGLGLVPKHLIHQRSDQARNRLAAAPKRSSWGDRNGVSKDRRRAQRKRERRNRKRGRGR